VLEKVERIGWLFGLYGELLTSKQQQLVKFYYFDDLSLAEIAVELGVSRQAVYFGLKRSEEALETYEKRLGLLAEQKTRCQQVQKLLGLITEYRDCLNPKFLDEAERILMEMLD